MSALAFEFLNVELFITLMPCGIHPMPPFLSFLEYDLFNTFAAVLLVF